MPLDDDRMPTLQEQVQGAALRRARARANHFFTDAGVPTTFLNTSFYWENFIYFGMGPQRGEDGKLALTLPMGDAKLPGIAAEDIGKVAYGIFKAGDELIGKTVGIAGEPPHRRRDSPRPSRRALGEEVRYNEVTPEAYRGFGFPGADDIGNMFQFKRDFEDDYRGMRDLDEARKLNPELLTFDEWLARPTSAAFPLA